MTQGGWARPGRTAAFAGVAMLVVYAATLAPDVTFWDAGEFIAAAHSLGIPHPPGTPLFVLLLNVWAKCTGAVLPYAVATNLFSAVCTAAAVAATAWLVAKGTGSGVAALAGAICAGAMSTVWSNATETEVYAASLALAMLTLASAERARREEGSRWLMLTAYLVALAVPLHLSALVAGPAAIVLVAQRDDGIDAARALLLGGAWLLAIAAGRVSPGVAVAGVLALTVAAVLLACRMATDRAIRVAIGSAAAGGLALSALAFMVVRARHDPFINQGNPASLGAWLDVIARRQYDVSPLWPRQAPWWIQAGNLGEYADWQVALGLGPTALPTVARTVATVAFLCLGAYGAAAHRIADRRTWRALAALAICGSIGVATYLNMKAGPSFGWGVLPDSAPHEARERDYFFALAFWSWGIWAGYGSVMLARTLRRRDVAGVAIAALPLVLNWRAVTRRAEPEATLPRTWATLLLEAAPRNAVLFASGDNDTYPLWYAQEALGVRRDVRVVTMPLLMADWDREELARRGALLPSSGAGAGEPFGTGLAREIAARATAAGRPVAATVYVEPRDRGAIGPYWQGNGLVYVMRTTADLQGSPSLPGVSVDSVGAAGLARRVGNDGRVVRPSLDPAGAFFNRLLGCPGYLSGRRARGAVVSLDSLCNFQ